MIDHKVRSLWVFAAITGPIFPFAVFLVSRVEPGNAGQMVAALGLAGVTLLGALAGYWALCILVYRRLKAGDQQELPAKPAPKLKSAAKAA